MSLLCCVVGTIGGFWNCRLHCSRSCLICLVRVDVDRGVCGDLVGVVEVCGVVVGVNGSARLDSCIVVGVCRIVVVVVGTVGVVDDVGDFIGVVVGGL